MLYPPPPRLSGRVHLEYWSESARERTEFLTEWVARLEAERIPTTVHEGWTRSDLTVFPHGWTSLRACTVQEDHSGGRRLLRVRLGLSANGEMRWAAGAVAVLAAVGLSASAAPVVATAAVLGAVAVAAWRVGLERRARVAALADAAAAAVGMVPVDADADRELAEAAVEATAVEPAPVEPAPVEPAPVEPAPVEPPAVRVPEAPALLAPLVAAPAAERVRYDEELRDREEVRDPAPVPEATSS